jgi:hypothetical protein
MLVAGCGDELLCPDSPLIVIESPRTTVTTDADPDAPGVQVDVRVQSNLVAGTSVTLTATDAAMAPVAMASGVVDTDGNAVVAGVTLPNGSLTLEVSSTDRCGASSDRVTVDVVAGLGCLITLAQTPTPNDFYDPLSVLNAGADPQPATPDLELGVTAMTAPGWDVEVFRTSGGAETSVATTTADASGAAGFTLALPQGEVGLRAECRGQGGAAASSLSTRFFVDTIAPTCAMASPVPGSTITPSYDLDGNLANGIQLVLDALIGGGDVQGEPTTFTVTVAGSAPVEVSGTLVDASGHSSAGATVDPPATPSSAMLAVAAFDHAGNSCTTTGEYAIVYDGCDIQVTAPTGPVSVDADGNPANGAQIDVDLLVDTTCTGRPVDSDCGLDPPSGTVPPGGALTMRVDMCATSPCEVIESCAFTVSTATGVETQAAVNLVFDALGPDVDVAVVAPALACGVQVTPSVDQQPGTPGVQVVARVTAASAVDHRVEVTSAIGTTTTPAPVDTAITLAPGTNALRGLADDAIGNVGASPVCTITLADLAVSFSAPAADGNVGGQDGTVTGSSLTFPLCGTVSTTGATVEVVVDGGPALPATVNGTGWCRSITISESPPSHTIVATAMKPPSFGESTLALAVDLDPPDPIAGFAAAVVNRQRVRLTWTAPADGGQPVDGYVAKYATAPITDANFDSIGTVIPTGAPQPPGQPETVDVFPARTGTTIWVAATSVDESGNRPPPSVVGPLTPAFDQTGAIAPGALDPGNHLIGRAIAHGRFNDDNIVDIAIGAPGAYAGPISTAGAVYVYFGGPGGIATTPDVVIEGTELSARAGSGLAAVSWVQGNREDLAIGVPGAGAGHGAVVIFNGGAGFPVGTVTTTDADRTIGVAANPGWFAASNLGFAVAAGQMDDDAIADLVISAPNGGPDRGGIVIVSGATVTTTLVGLSTVDAAAANGAIATLIEDPDSTIGRAFGNHLHVVGPTQGIADAIDDIVVGYADDNTTTGDAAYLFRPDGTPPAMPGVTAGGFVIGRDVRLELADSNLITELGSQASTIDDQNGDGARDLAITAYRATGGGKVFILDGDTVGTAGIVQIGSPGLTLTTISGGIGAARLGAVLGRHTDGSADVNGDGLDDLLIGCVIGGVGQVNVWFGGEIPSGTATAASADYTIVTPPTFLFSAPSNLRGPAGHLAWIGDIDGDGLEDVAYSSPSSNNRDGGFELMY